MNKVEGTPNVIVIIQARVSSTRLPNKVLKLVAEKPILYHVYERLSHVKRINKIVVATTTEPDDDAIENFCFENNIGLFRGSLNNVLERYFRTAQFYKADIIIRITSDCPLIDPEIVNEMLNLFLLESSKSNIDFLSNTIHRTFPRGLDVEIFTMDALEQTFREASLPFEQEHVTPFIYRNPDKFVIKNYASPHDFSFHRWTVDTNEDFILISEIFNSLYHKKQIFLMNDVLDLFSRRPELIQINNDVTQKKLGE